MTYSFMIMAAPDCPRGYLGQLPEHIPERADRLIQTLDYPKFNARCADSVQLHPKVKHPIPRPFNFTDMLNARLYPPASTLLGAYEKAYILVDEYLLRACLRLSADSQFGNILKVYPDGTIFMMHTQNSSNSYHYALYESGQLVREHAGDIDNFSSIEMGDPAPEEQEDYARSKVIDGERIFYKEMMFRNKPQIEEFTVDCYGETLAFAIASRFFGEVDSVNHPQCLKGDKLMGELFT